MKNTAEISKSKESENTPLIDKQTKKESQHLKTSSISVNRVFKKKSTSSELDVTFNKDILSTAVPLKQRHQNLIPIDKEKEIDKIFNGRKSAMRKTFAGSSDKKKSVAPKIHLNNTTAIWANFDPSHINQSENSKQSQIKTLELLAKCKVYDSNIDNSYKNKIDKIFDKNSKVEQAINEFIELVNIDEAEDMNMEQMVEEINTKNEQNYDNFLKKSELDKFRESNIRSTLFCRKIGNRSMWKPDKYKGSRKVKVAETFEELLTH